VTTKPTIDFFGFCGERRLILKVLLPTASVGPNLQKRGMACFLNSPAYSMQNFTFYGTAKGDQPSGGAKLAFGTRFLYEGRLVVLDRERKMTSIFTARPFGVSA